MGSREERIVAAAEAFVSSQEMQRGWGNDYEFPYDEYATLKQAVGEPSRAAFRLFELTMTVYLPEGAELPVTFQEWLERVMR